MGIISKKLPPVEYLHQCFEIIDHCLVWKERPPTHFKNKGGDNTFNKQFKGCFAGSINNTGYLVVNLSYKGNSVKYLAHRILYKMYKGVEPEFVDHLNGITVDNREVNLVSVSHKDNHKNQKLSKNNKSGVKGVSWCNSMNKWRVCIMLNGKQQRFGYYENIKDAEEVALKKYQELGFSKRHSGEVV